MDDDYVVTPGGVVDIGGNPAMYDSSGNVYSQSNIDDYVVTPGGVVDAAGNPVKYDSSGNIIDSVSSSGVSPSDSNFNLSGLTSLLAPFKGIFDRLKSGNTTANDVNAALGVLGLLMPALNRPQTAGWKGSIDLNKQFTRTPIAQPEYKPYAQSASPVMGRQFFTSTYGAPPAPAAVPAPAAAAQPTPASLPASRETGDGTESLAQTITPTTASSPAVAPASAPAYTPMQVAQEATAQPVASSANATGAEPVLANDAMPAMPTDNIVEQLQALVPQSPVQAYEAPYVEAQAPLLSAANLPDAVAMPAPVTDSGIARILSQAPAPVAAAVAAPVAPAAPSFAKFDPLQSEGNLTLRNLLGYGLETGNRLGHQGVEMTADELQNWMLSTGRLTPDDITNIKMERGLLPKPTTAPTPTFMPSPAPGMSYEKFTGWDEYFTPEGQYRRFSSTGTPITPMMFGEGTGAIQGTAISPYSVPSNILGFMPDKPGYDAAKAADEATVKAAQGGLMGLARGGRAMPPRYLRGQTDGMADKIPSNIDGVQPAKLSHGEFVIPADVVSHLGNGNSDAGAKVLYKMMDRVRQARTGNKKQGRQINPEKFTPGGIAGYAGGGAVAFPDGGEVKAPTAPLGSSTEQNIAEWAGPYVGDMLSKTSALTNTPYQAYEGPLVAGTAPLQSKVFGGLESLNFPGQLGQSFSAQGAYQLPSMTPGGVAGQQAGLGGIASQYMNPYLSAVLTPQLDELRRQSQITQMGTAGKLAQAGAYGGSRQAIMDAETQRNLLAEQNKAIGTGYANAYDRAMGQFNVEQGQAKTLADMMAGAGQQQRGIEQEGITALQKQYETELLDPYTKLRFQKEMLGGLPVATAATTANTSTMGDLKGGLADLQTALKNLGL